MPYCNNLQLFVNTPENDGSNPDSIAQIVRRQNAVRLKF